MLARARDLEALSYCLATWAGGVRPKVHFGTPRTEMRSLPGSSRIKAPTWTEHSDFVSPFEFMAFVRLAEGLLPPLDRQSVFGDNPRCPQYDGNSTQVKLDASLG